MAANFNITAEHAKVNPRFAGNLRSAEPFNKDIVNAEVAQHAAVLNAALEKLSTAKPDVVRTAAGETTFTSCRITGSSSPNCSLLHDLFNPTLSQEHRGR